VNAKSRGNLIAAIRPFIHRPLNNNGLHRNSYTNGYRYPEIGTGINVADTLVDTPLFGCRCLICMENLHSGPGKVQANGSPRPRIYEEARLHYS
jgi:hypothetical protein